MTQRIHAQKYKQHYFYAGKITNNINYTALIKFSAGKVSIAHLQSKTKFEQKLMQT
jgi:hypothetical protein